MSSLVETTSLHLMSRLRPMSMCINGTKDAVITLASAVPLGMFCRDREDGTYAARGNVDGDMIANVELMTALAQCGTITGCAG